MYALGIPHRQYRRATQVLGHERSSPIPYESVKQDDGFWLFTFPEADEYDFRDIVILLKGQGVSTIGADTQLTERKIMKLSDLLKEEEGPIQNELLDKLKDTLTSWEKPTYMGGIDYCERSNQHKIDLENIIEDLENPISSPGEEDKIEKDDEDLANAEDDINTMEEGSSTKNKLNERLQQLAGIKPLYEQSGFQTTIQCPSGFTVKQLNSTGPQGQVQNIATYTLNMGDEICYTCVPLDKSPKHKEDMGGL